MPVFNTETFLNETINSILCQTFIDFELLALDDGATDRSSEIIQSCKDPRVHYISCAHVFISTLNMGIESRIISVPITHDAKSNISFPCIYNIAEISINNFVKDIYKRKIDYLKKNNYSS